MNRVGSTAERIREIRDGIGAGTKAVSSSIGAVDDTSGVAGDECAVRRKGGSTRSAACLDANSIVAADGAGYIHRCSTSVPLRNEPNTRNLIGNTAGNGDLTVGVCPHAVAVADKIGVINGHFDGAGAGGGEEPFSGIVG